AWGGAPLPIEVIRAYRRLGVQLMTVYGMTETIASITFTDHDASDEVLAETVGRFDPGMQVRLADEHDHPVAAGEQGEVQVRHEGLFLEYFGRPDATAAAYSADGWFRTGDVGVLRPDGNLRLVGRRSDMIKSGGYNVYPREIELCLETRDDVALAAVIGRPDEKFGEVAVAYVVPRGGTPPTPEQLRDFCRDQLANYKVPKDFVIVDELPLLPVGKVDKQELRRRARS
ncbi:MAG: AMP-binding protein, partial [Burkholderiales bacterium]|nr:AMP-binding protein [Burkholderiales bacterium]